MSVVELRGLGTVAAPHSISAEETKHHLSRLLPSSRRWTDMVDATRIRSRPLILPPEELLRHRTLGERSDEYARAAIHLADAAARAALAEAAIEPARIGSIISISCTGYMMPSVDAHLVPRLGLRRSVRRIPITQLGCSGGVAALALASSLLARSGDESALVIAVEPCSSCLQTAEPSASDIMGTILFGDAAAAVVLTSTATPGRFAIVATGSEQWPDSHSALGMRLTSAGLRFVLSPRLPGIVRRHVRQTVLDFLARNGVTSSDIGFWVIHPGGPKILHAIAEALELDPSALAPAWNVWESYGNLSSATVFFILREVERSAITRPSLGVMMALGPGIACELALIRAVADHS
jgi:alkylresorcinol/alkylpyrone synthase